MKKFLSLICALALVVGMLTIGAVSAGATAAQTAVDVKAGDEVSYALSLGGVKDDVIGCDFSVYYDPNVFEVESVADFSNSTNKSDWRATINPNLSGEVRGNWSILSGVDFSDKRNFVTVNLKAKTGGTGHISYFVRYMYDESVFDDVQTKPQINDYVFTCDVSVNGQTVAENAQPELNVEEPQSSGNFVNSKSGDSKDADPNDPDTVADNKTSGGSGSNTADNNSNDNNEQLEVVEVTDADGNVVATEARQGATAKDNTQSTTGGNNPGQKSGSVEAATDAEGNTIAAADTDTDGDTPAESKGGTSSALWIIIIVILVAACAAVAYFLIKKRKAPAAAGADPDDADNNDASI